MKLILDSGSNLRKEEIPENAAVVPLFICTDEKEFKDDENLDVMGMVEYLENAKCPSHSACPGIDDFAGELEGEKNAIIITLAARLSGCYNSAYTAAGLYIEENADSTVYVIDSNAIGPSERLLYEKFLECEKQGLNVDETYDILTDYSYNHLKIGFCLKSLTNLANNGRISPVIAKFTSVVGIQIVGTFTDWGELQPTHKARGEKKACEAMISDMIEAGYKGGKVRIDHCDGLDKALLFKDVLKEKFPGCDVSIGETTGLCSFYAERGGIVFSFEK